ncbi:MAG TPA: nucleotide disphospho-sugar-binding domain-containing protein [Luteitalea sp.]|nr:nucleotide disphospho-sugar-binding domain-containing protein [Luteitalea sp.]
MAAADVRFGIISPPVPGHLNPFIALGQTLRDAGHDVVFVQMADVAARVERAGLAFVPIGASDHPVGSLAQSLDTLGRLHGHAALKHVVQAVSQTTRMFAREGLDALREARVDALLVDQTEPIGAVLAERLGVPFVTVCNALLVNREAGVPPPFTAWSPSESWPALLRNQAGYLASDFALRAVHRVVAEQRTAWGMTSWRSMDDSFSPLAQLSQQPAAFDFPRRSLPPTFHYCGPFRHAAHEDTPFDWSRLDGRPLVYGSLGTLQGSKREVFGTFVDACSDLNVQLVLSHGGALDASAVRPLESRAVVVSYAPQRAILARAAAGLTHAGLNTVLDALSAGVPLVAVPLAFEQPAIGARVAWTGTGRVVPFAKLSRHVLRTSLEAVLTQPSYRQAAARVQHAIADAGGAERAARVAVTACATGRPVLASV